MTNNNKFVPVAPKTYEVKYVEVKDQSNLSKLAGYLGIKTAYACNKNPCYCIDVSKYSAAAQQTAAAMEVASVKAAQYGGTAETKVNKDGSSETTYKPEKKEEKK